MRALGMALAALTIAGASCAPAPRIVVTDSPKSQPIASVSAAPAPKPTLATTPPPPPVAPAAPTLPPCPVPEEGTAAGPLTGERLKEATDNLPEIEKRKAVAKVLGVTCDVDAPKFDVAFVQALARFQRRYGRFEDEVTGRINMRTRRVLEMIHAELRPAGHRCENYTPSPKAPKTALPACLLYWRGASKEQVRFMRRVYEIAQKRSSHRRPFVLAADEVDIIETGPCPGKPADLKPDCERAHWAQRDAAKAAKRLLDDARKTFDADRAKHGQRNLLVYTGYRAATFQLEIWEHHFPGRYKATQKARKRSRGGAHGEAAALLLAQYFGARTAPPGYSLHNRGMAIDFGCVTKKGGWIGSNGSFVKAWKKSSCFRWMEKNASRFGFYPNTSIDEPWHWEFHPER